MCTAPLHGYPPADPSVSAKWVWSSHKSYAGAVASVFACGRCNECRRDHARDWSTRCYHEASVHEANCFVTLTFDPEHLPRDWSVDPRPLQLFHKRVNRALGGGLRYFACGEYGSERLRPHFHSLLFGFCPDDLRFWKVSAKGHRVYLSERLQALWPYGHSYVQLFDVGAANYVASYAVKKAGVDRDDRSLRRECTDPVTGEFREWYVRPPLLVMSRRPGVGWPWFQRFSGDAFPADFVIVDGQKRPVPAYYRQLLADRDAFAAMQLGVRRKAGAREVVARGEMTDRRLLVKHELRRLEVERVSRSFEADE